MRTDSESYLVSVYRCPTRLPKREGHKEHQEGEEEQEGEGEQQVYSLPPGGYDGPPEMMYEGGPGLRRKKMSFQIGKKKEIHPKKTFAPLCGLPSPSSDLNFCSEPGKILILIDLKIILCYSLLCHTGLQTFCLNFYDFAC